MGRKGALWSERKESHFLNWRYIRFQRLLLLSEQLISGIEKIEASSPSSSHPRPRSLSSTPKKVSVPS